MSTVNYAVVDLPIYGRVTIEKRNIRTTLLAILISYLLGQLLYTATRLVLFDYEASGNRTDGKN
jgi:hypothetical protein